MPEELAPRRLVRRAAWIAGALALAALVLALAPGLGDVRRLLVHADPAWVVVVVAFEALSCMSYVLMFRPVFCQHMPWRTSWEIGLAELAAGSIIPASGAGGLALGAWILHQGGMSPERIARRSVAFFLITSAVNFVAVAVVGTLMALGVIGPHRALWLTAVPAAAALVVIAAVLAVPRLGEGAPPPAGAGTVRRGVAQARKSLVQGIAEAVQIERGRNLLVIVGSVGYLAWDIAAVWAAYRAFGHVPPVSVVVLAYLVGQLAGLLPIPGGIGAIDGGLIGTLVLYGADPAATVAAVFLYRVVLFWLPLIAGSVAFVSLRRGLNRPDRPDLCVVPAAT